MNSRIIRLTPSLVRSCRWNVRRPVFIPHGRRGYLEGRRRNNSAHRRVHGRQKETSLIRWRGRGSTRDDFEAAALVHLDAVFGVALRLTHNRAEAEDIVQEAYLRAFRHFDRFDPGTNCRAWLFTILRNVFLNRRRQAGREILDEDGHELAPEGDAGPAHAPPLESPEDRFFRSVLHGDVDRALKTLPQAFREAVILADLEGLTYREVAGVLGCPIGTVMSRLSRGRDLLRRQLSGFGREHGYLRESETE